MAGNIESLEGVLEPIDFTVKGGKTRISDQKLVYQGLPVFPGYPFEYSFLDENIKRMYDAEKKQGNIFNYFTFVAIFIACLGLYGLALNMTEQRTKEIGIRKVLGSRVSGIVLMLSKESLTLVFIANLIAWPLAFYTMNTWLQSFVYRINIGIGTFVLSSALALIIAMLSITHQSVKAATANPVDSLRYNQQ
jgi:putative ABC transport system permease protein